MSPSLAPRYNATSHAHSHHNPPQPSLHGVWAILSLAFVVCTISAVLFYALYSCCHSAKHSELPRKNGYRARNKSKTRSRVTAQNSDFTPFDTISEKSWISYLIGEPPDTKQESLESHFQLSSDSSYSLDITSSPLAVTYPMRSSDYGEPISPLPPSYQPLDNSTTLSFDRNNIPFITPQRRIDPKLGPIQSSFENSSTISCVYSPHITTDPFHSKPIQHKTLPKTVTSAHAASDSKENAPCDHHDSSLTEIDLSSPVKSSNAKRKPSFRPSSSPSKKKVATRQRQESSHSSSCRTTRNNAETTAETYTRQVRSESESSTKLLAFLVPR
ncbi:hypothetical protein K435DRAFT_276468 [Dendrothele bispora CBS 962.96]|uniref:Uncharacterized protein n=1 Tax=Dendrothele bispora (strain CBS 962.96) TaxID=1314807 RepID=A0A4S8LLZ2_DENBC|nr:hypothetical protein K435DRAFT_276468 [Dendrothele bispora CBS 962.96]